MNAAKMRSDNNKTNTEAVDTVGFRACFCQLPTIIIIIMIIIVEQNTKHAPYSTSNASAHAHADILPSHHIDIAYSTKQKNCIGRVVFFFFSKEYTNKRNQSVLLET